MFVVAFVDSEETDLEARVVVELPKAGGVWLRADEAVLAEKRGPRDSCHVVG